MDPQKQTIHGVGSVLNLIDLGEKMFGGRVAANLTVMARQGRAGQAGRAG